MRVPVQVALLTFWSWALASSTWTVFDVHRSPNADHTLCTWTLRINQSTLVGSSPVSCDFLVKGNSTVGCERRTISDVSCSDGVSHFNIEGGWSEQGFIVLSIVDTVKQLRGWFGWSDEILDSGEKIPKQEKFVKPINEKSQRFSLAVRDNNNSGTLEGALAWKVTNLERMVFGFENKIWINFTVEDEAQQNSHCSLMVSGPKPQDDGGAHPIDLGKWSWYNRECSESAWSVSWGVMEKGDAAVMTVVNPARNRRCMFGFNDVNEAQDLGSAGPYPVSDCDCA